MRKTKDKNEDIKCFAAVDGLNFKSLKAKKITHLLSSKDVKCHAL